MAERLASGSEGQQVTPIEVPTKPTERGSIKLGLFARVFGVTAVVLALSLACKNAEEPALQTPTTPPPVEFNIPLLPENKRQTVDEALEFVVQKQLEYQTNLVETDDFYTSAHQGGPSGDPRTELNTYIYEHGAEDFLRIWETAADALRWYFGDIFCEISASFQPMNESSPETLGVDPETLVTASGC